MVVVVSRRRGLLTGDALLVGDAGGGNSLRLTASCLKASSASTVTRIRWGDRSSPTSSWKVRFLGDCARGCVRELPFGMEKEDRSCCDLEMRRVAGRAELGISSASGSGDERSRK